MNVLQPARPATPLPSAYNPWSGLHIFNLALVHLTPRGQMLTVTQRHLADGEVPAHTCRIQVTWARVPVGTCYCLHAASIQRHTRRNDDL